MVGYLVLCVEGQSAYCYTLDMTSYDWCFLSCNSNDHDTMSIREEIGGNYDAFFVFVRGEKIAEIPVGIM